MARDNDRGRQEAQGSASYAFAVAFAAALGGFLFGYDLAIISGANVFLREQFALSDRAFGLASTSATLGCVAGPLLGPWFCDSAGRKNTLIVGSILLAVSAVLTAVPRDIATFNVFRFVGGVGVGLCSVASPMYIAETACAERRGALGLMYQLSIVVGCVCAAVVAWILARWVQEATSWRWMFGSELAPIGVFGVLLALVPRSPRWLAEKGRFEEALAVLVKLNGRARAQAELEEIRASLSEQTGTFSELIRPPLRFPLLVGVLLAVFNSWTGWSAMAPYLPTLFIRGGFPAKADAIFQFVIAYGFMGLVTVLAVWLVDRVGRRPLWIFSSLFMTGALAVAGLVFHYNLSGPVLLLTIFLCAVPHALALGSLPWLMMSEIFPTRVRAKAVAVTTTVLWVGAFSGGLVFPVLTGGAERRFGSIAPAIWLFGGISLLAFFFGLLMLPETKGKTLEEIGRLWMSRKGRAPCG